MIRSHRFLYIPDRLDFNELLQSHPIDKYKAVTADKLAFICHSIILVSLKFRNDTDLINDFVPLHSQILKRSIPNYQVCKQYLIDAKVIECRNEYVIGEQSIGFKFCSNYFGMGLKKYEIKSRDFQKRISTSESKDQFQKKLNSRAKHLYQYLEDGKLNISRDAALEWIENSRVKHLEEIRKTQYWQKYDQLKDSINDRFDKYVMSVEQFNEGWNNPKVDISGHRFFTVLTNLKKELRNYITYDRKKLVSLDFKCSQPYLTLLLLSKDFYSSDLSKDAITLKKIYPELYKHLKAEGYLTGLKRISVETKTLGTKVLDVADYKKSIIDNDYYECLATLISSFTNGELILSRDAAKTQSHYILFADPKKMSWAVGYNAFKKAFPTVAKLFCILKSRSYNDLAILLQRIESELVIQKITKEFVKQFPGIPIYTIHDSIITISEYSTKLISISGDLSRKMIGVFPKIEVEDWIPSRANNLMNQIKFSKAEKKIIKNLMFKNKLVHQNKN